MIAENAETFNQEIKLWDPESLLQQSPENDVNFSRGFLRSRPEKWCPGFSAHWLPLAHSIGVDMKVLEVRPVLNIPSNIETGFIATHEGQNIGLFIDDQSEKVIVNAFIPGSNRKASDVLLEYMARRFLSSLAQVWSGTKSAKFSFKRKARPSEFNAVGAVKLSAEINSFVCSVWVLLEEDLVSKLDGLWRRQIASVTRTNLQNSNLTVELASFVASQNSLSDYVSKGKLVVLDNVVSDNVTLRVNSKPWLSARLLNVDGSFAIETLAAPLPASNMYENSLRVSLEIGSFEIDAATLAEMGQPGSMMRTPFQLTNSADLCVNGNVSASAEVLISGGKLAYRVLP